MKSSCSSTGMRPKGWRERCGSCLDVPGFSAASRQRAPFSSSVAMTDRENGLPGVAWTMNSDKGALLSRGLSLFWSISLPWTRTRSASRPRHCVRLGPGGTLGAMTRKPPRLGGTIDAHISAPSCPQKGIDPPSFGDSLTLRLDLPEADEHGNHGSSRPDGWRGVAAVGPAYGPQRNPARLRSRPAPVAGEGAEQ